MFGKFTLKVPNLWNWGWIHKFRPIVPNKNGRLPLWHMGDITIEANSVTSKVDKVPTLQNDSQEHDDLWNKNHTSIITTIIKVPPLQNESQEHDDNSDFKNVLCLLKCFKGWWGQWKLKSHNCITSSFARIVIEVSKLKIIQIVMVVILKLTIVVMKGGGFDDLQNKNQNHHRNHHHHRHLHHHHRHHHHHHH